jgi:hypothetical protein
MFAFQSYLVYQGHSSWKLWLKDKVMHPWEAIDKLTLYVVNKVPADEVRPFPLVKDFGGM